jgi:hypothetical protein
MTPKFACCIEKDDLDKDICPSCYALATTYASIDTSRGTGNVEYCLHELAHYVVVFGKQMPKTKQEAYNLQVHLDNLGNRSCARSQLHELRVLELQHIVLGRERKALIESSWPGIRDVWANVGHPVPRQRDAVPTRARAEWIMKRMLVSKRLVKAYKQSLEAFSK